MTENKPLYLRAKDKELGELQIMDRPTLEWIRENSLSKVEEYEKYNNLIPKLVKEDFDLIESLIPKKEDFYSPEHFYSIHGLSHILRVMFLTILVCKLIGEKDYLSYLISASIHDIRRVNDNQDKGHGLRAKNWFLEKQDRFSDIKYDLKTVTETSHYHETDYQEIDAETLSKHKREIDIFKACDALDRFRQPKEKWWINPEYVELKQALVLMPVARKFTLQSEDMILEGLDIKKAVFETAKKLFL